MIESNLKIREANVTVNSIFNLRRKTVILYEFVKDEILGFFGL